MVPVRTFTTFATMPSRSELTTSGIGAGTEEARELIVDDGTGESVMVVLVAAELCTRI